MTVIHVTPADSYTVIEAAMPGDEVILAPGTYTNRLYLTAAGSASAPITIHAEDPSNPPVVDFGTTLVEDAPGSYGGGDKGRGCCGWESHHIAHLSALDRRLASSPVLDRGFAEPQRAITPA